MSQNTEYETLRIFRCRHMRPDFTGNFTNMATYCKKKDGEKIDKDVCEHCDMFDSKFIEYPIAVSAINQKGWSIDNSLYKDSIGKAVMVKMVGDEYGDETFFGIHLGEFPIEPIISHNRNSKELKVIPMFNPAIYIPKLQKIVFGCETWWSMGDKKSEKEIVSQLMKNYGLEDPHEN